MTIRVKSMDHVTLVSSDLQRTRAFYVDLLGMESVPRPAFAFPGLWFQAGATQIHVNLAGDEAGHAGMPPHAGSQPSRGYHLALLVDDVHAATEVMRQQNVPIVSGPRQRPDGAVQVYVYDPDGYLVELCSAP